MRRSIVCLAWLLLMGPASAAQVGKEAQAAPAFDELAAKITCNWFREERWVVVKGNGDVEFSLRERPAGNVAYRAAFRLGDEPRREFERLLAATEWLAKPLKDPRQIIDAVELDVALSRGGQTQRLHCYGDPPAPYGPLAVFLLRVHRQEHLLYQLTKGSPDDQLHASREVAQELRAVEGAPLLTRAESRVRRGDPGARPRRDAILDFYRFVEPFVEMLARPENRRHDEIVAAVKLLGYLRVEAQRASIAALAQHPNAEVRRAVVQAMLHLGGQQAQEAITSLAEDQDRSVRDGVTEALFKLQGAKAIPTLKAMLPKTPRAGFVLLRLGKEAVPTCVEIIEQATDRTSAAAVNLIRAYLDHSDELPDPPDPRLAKAVEKNLHSFGTPWCAYAVQFLRLARPGQAVGVQGLIDVPWGDASGGLQCRLLPGRQAVGVAAGTKPEETVVEALYELRNVGEQPVKFLKRGTPLEGGAFDSIFSVYGPQGRFARFIQPKAERTPYRREDFITIKPGETLSQRVRLPHDFTAPGRYDVQICHPKWLRPESSPLRLYYGSDTEAAKLNPANVWAGQLISNLVIVSVASPAPPAGQKEPR